MLAAQFSGWLEQKIATSWEGLGVNKKITKAVKYEQMLDNRLSKISTVDI